MKPFIYYATFGTGHSHHGHYQPILADTLERAERIMFETYGSSWAAMYTEEEFNKSKQQGFFVNLKPLPDI